MKTNVLRSQDGKTGGREDPPSRRRSRLHQVSARQDGAASGVLPPSAGSGQAHGAFPRGVLAHGHQEDPPTRRGYGAASVKTSWESKRPVRSTVCCARQGRQLPELKAEIAVQRTHQRRKSFRLYPPFPPLTAFGDLFLFWRRVKSVDGRSTHERTFCQTKPS
jgi:hypothetical protein